MSGTWQTVWEIAGKRHMTKMGENHLSEHAHEVLQQFVVNEAQEVMMKALGGSWNRPTEGFCARASENGR